MNATRLYLTSATITFAVMLARVGCTDRPAILQAIGLILLGLLVFATVVIMMGLILGLPLLVVTLIANGLSRLFPGPPPNNPWR